MIITAAAAAAGLFPPSAEQTWNPELNWYCNQATNTSWCHFTNFSFQFRLPIPIHTIPKILDHVVYVGRPCARFDRAFRKYLESPEYKEEIGKFKYLIQYLEEHAGIVIKEDLEPLQSLYDTLFIENLKNFSLPDWAEVVFGPGTQFEWAANSYFQIYTATPELARLSYGFTVRDIFDRCTEVIKGTLSPNRSLWYVDVLT